jgi:predicted DNA-binding protein
VRGKKAGRANDVDQVVEHLLNELENLSSNPSTTDVKNKTRRGDYQVITSLIVTLKKK